MKNLLICIGAFILMVVAAPVVFYHVYPLVEGLTTEQFFYNLGAYTPVVAFVIVCLVALLRALFRTKKCSDARTKEDIKDNRRRWSA